MISFGEEYISKEMQKAKELIFEIENIYNEFPKRIKDNEKYNLAIGCLNTSLSHHKTIVLSVSYLWFICISIISYESSI